MKESLYDAIGGLPTLQRVHKIFYDKVYEHPWLGQFFEGFDQQVIEDKQSSFMSEKFGGPAYTGKPLRQVHENMYLPQELVDLRHEILHESLKEAGLSEDLIERWLRIDAAFMKQVVKTSVASFYKDYPLKYKQRIFHPKPPESSS